MQSILTYIIIALAVAYAVWRIIRRIRGKGNACGCGGSGNDICPECQKGCDGCPLLGSCNHKK
ncbi:MAG: hypothetical protein Q4E32_07305 [Bacteroidales bacterium]|nr:hypothetical protein [Bacteroidales bacterium]